MTTISINSERDATTAANREQVSVQPAYFDREQRQRLRLLRKQLHPNSEHLTTPRITPEHYGRKFWLENYLISHACGRTHFSEKECQ